MAKHCSSTRMICLEETDLKKFALDCSDVPEERFNAGIDCVSVKMHR